jgi:hypothetical protein
VRGCVVFWMLACRAVFWTRCHARERGHPERHVSLPVHRARNRTAGDVKRRMWEEMDGARVVFWMLAFASMTLFSPTRASRFDNRRMHEG